MQTLMLFISVSGVRDAVEWLMVQGGFRRIHLRFPRASVGDKMSPIVKCSYTLFFLSLELYIYITILHRAEVRLRLNGRLTANILSSRGAEKRARRIHRQQLARPILI